MSTSTPLKITDIFNENVFTTDVAKHYLDGKVYEKLLRTLEDKMLKITREEAFHIAAALKLWAMERGATHYTHWFQPLSGATAVKHDAFFSRTADGSYMEDFDGHILVQQESDASSFPNGGLRSTFEARGYTAWDPSSPPFILEQSNGKTLCIPTIFISYTGHSLDYKGPLLKSVAALQHEALEVARLIDKNITKITPTLGWEQEYFLLDDTLARARPDLLYTGRTLVGARAPKGQQLSDHYFGNIPARVHGFMRAFEHEAYKLGIPLKTRHNEVAPCQFECAPIFEEINIAIDHNTLLMDLMRAVSKNHGLKVIFHEKPFSDVNGSGKHCNWSLSTQSGKNLLSPGDTPKSNLLFLSFFVSIIKAVHDHAGLLQASIASAGNDQRLGGHEAPPAIISVFVGSALSTALHEIISPSHHGEEDNRHFLQRHLQPHTPEILIDNTDRNRTSPFAFTGNKFEFRAPGASANCAWPVLVLNTIIADSLRAFHIDVHARIAKGIKKEQALMESIQSYIRASQSILFEGDGYSSAWEKEAEKRGLHSVRHTPDALGIWKNKTTQALFERCGVFSADEISARYEIEMQKYVTTKEIEIRVLEEMIDARILPAAIAYQNELLENVRALEKSGFNASTQAVAREKISAISVHIHELSKLLEALRERWNSARDKSLEDRARVLAEDIDDSFRTIKTHADWLEKQVSAKYWTLPKQMDLLHL